MCILYKWLCFHVLYCTVPHRVQYLYFKTRMSRSKCKNSGNVAGTAKRHQKSEVQRKERRETRERSNWRTRESHNAGNGEGILFEILLAFEAQNPNIEQYTKVAAAIQNTIQCPRVIEDERKKKKKELRPRHHWILSFMSIDRIEFGKEPSTSGMNEIAACPPSPMVNDASAPPSPTSSPSSSQYLFLLVHSMPTAVCQIL